MNREKLLDCLKEISNHFGSGLFQIIDEDEMLECGAIDNTCKELEEAVDLSIKLDLSPSFVNPFCYWFNY